MHLSNLGNRRSLPRGRSSILAGRFALRASSFAFAFAGGLSKVFNKTMDNESSGRFPRALAD